MELIDFLPLISAIFVFYLGLLVLLRDIKARTNFTFFLLTLAIGMWLFGTFMMFLHKDNVELALFWDRFVYIGVIFIPVFMYHFSLAYTSSRRDRILIVGYALSILFLIVSRTEYFVDGVFYYQWGIHSKAQLFHHLFLAHFFTLVVLWFVKMIKYYRNLESHISKERTRYVILGFLFLCTIGPTAYFPAYGIGVYPFAYMSGVIFTIVLSYAILRHKLFNIKIVLAELLVVGFSVLLLINIFISSTVFEYVWKSFLFLMFLILGSALVRSVFREIEAYEEIQKYAEKLKKANAKLKELDRQKTEFMSFAAHQLKSPLTSVKGFTSLLLNGSFGEVPPKAKSIVEKMHDATETMAESVEDYLNITRIEQGRMNYDISEFDVYEVASSVVEELRPTAYQSGNEISMESDKYKKYQVKADKNKIKQVVNNFVDNAIKYTPEGGKIWVRISKNNKKKTVLVEVKDNGIGMNQETLDKIFQRYSRAEGAKKIKGSGLGLFIAKVMVEAQEGRVGADSPGEGKGSIFFIELPQAQ